MQQKHRHSNITLLAPGFAPGLSLVRRIAFGAAALALLLTSTCSLHAAAAAPTHTTLAATAAASGSGVELSAAVKTAAGESVSSGTVDFLLSSGQSLGSAIVGSNGTANLSVASLPAATSTSVDGGSDVLVTAAYHAPAGSDALANSSSAAVAAPEATTQAPDFSVTAAPTTVTVTAGNYGNSVLTVSSLAGYTGAIEFSCSNLPAQVTCAFNPTQQTLTADGSFASTLQISTQGTSGPQTSLLQGRGTGTIALALLFPGSLLLLIGSSGRRRKLFRGAQLLGLVLLLTGGGLGLSGCSQRYGYLHHPPLTATGTPTGTYTINVAVDGSQGASAIEHDIAISLVVQ